MVGSFTMVYCETCNHVIPIINQLLLHSHLSNSKGPSYLWEHFILQWLRCCYSKPMGTTLFKKKSSMTVNLNKLPSFKFRKNRLTVSVRCRGTTTINHICSLVYSTRETRRLERSLLDFMFCY